MWVTFLYHFSSKFFSLKQFLSFFPVFYLCPWALNRTTLMLYMRLDDPRPAPISCFLMTKFISCHLSNNYTKIILWTSPHTICSTLLSIHERCWSFHLVMVLSARFSHHIFIIFSHQLISILLEVFHDYLSNFNSLVLSIVESHLK